MNLKRLSLQTLGSSITLVSQYKELKSIQTLGLVVVVVVVEVLVVGDLVVVLVVVEVLVVGDLVVVLVVVVVEGVIVGDGVVAPQAALSLRHDARIRAI